MPTGGTCDAMTTTAKSFGEIGASAARSVPAARDHALLRSPAAPRHWHLTRKCAGERRCRCTVGSIPPAVMCRWLHARRWLWWKTAALVTRIHGAATMIANSFGGIGRTAAHSVRTALGRARSGCQRVTSTLQRSTSKCAAVQRCRSTTRSIRRMAANRWHRALQ